MVAFKVVKLKFSHSAAGLSIRTFSHPSERDKTGKNYNLIALIVKILVAKDVIYVNFFSSLLFEKARGC